LFFLIKSIVPKQVCKNQFPKYPILLLRLAGASAMLPGCVRRVVGSLTQSQSGVARRGAHNEGRRITRVCIARQKAPAASAHIQLCNTGQRGSKYFCYFTPWRTTLCVLSSVFLLGQLTGIKKGRDGKCVYVYTYKIHWAPAAASRFILLGMERRSPFASDWEMKNKAAVRDGTIKLVAYLIYLDGHYFLL